MVSSEEEMDTKSVDTADWDADMEIQLFYAMADHKPVGINRHFQMACIYEKFANTAVKDSFSTYDIWKHLETMYELPLLDETEVIPFPNSELAFDLSESEFGHLIKQKYKEPVRTDDSEDGRSPSPRTATPRSSSRGVQSKENTPKATRKDSITALATKSRKESGSSHASTDTPSIKSEKDFDRRRDSRDSNASGPKDSASKKSTSSKESKSNRPKAWDSPLADDESASRRGRRRPATSTPPAVPAKRRRT